MVGDGLSAFLNTEPTRPSFLSGSCSEIDAVFAFSPGINRLIFAETLRGKVAPPDSMRTMQCLSIEKVAGRFQQLYQHVFQQEVMIDDLLGTLREINMIPALLYWRKNGSLGSSSIIPLLYLLKT